MEPLALAEPGRFVGSAKNSRAPLPVGQEIHVEIHGFGCTSELAFTALVHAIGTSSDRFRCGKVRASRVAASRLRTIGGVVPVYPEKLLGDALPMRSRRAVRKRRGKPVQCIRVFASISDPTQRSHIVAFVRASEVSRFAVQCPVEASASPARVRCTLSNRGIGG